MQDSIGSDAKLVIFSVCQIELGYSQRNPFELLVDVKKLIDQ